MIHSPGTIAPARPAGDVSPGAPEPSVFGSKTLVQLSSIGFDFIRKRAGAKPAQARLAVGSNSVFAQQAHKPALYLHPVGREDTGLVGGIGCFEGYRIAAAAQARFSVASSSSTSATTISPVEAMSCLRISTVSPSKMPASIIESPRTSSA